MGNLMKMGILVSSIGNFGDFNYYNSQEIGLAKELSNYFEEIVIFKAIRKKDKFDVRTIKSNVILKPIIVRNFGINGFVDPNNLDREIRVLLHFSDTQLCVPQIYYWTKKNNIVYLPYIGVLESHSRYKLVSMFIDIMFKRNIKVYKKCCCLVKNPTVEKQLLKYGVSKVQLVPVGLDLTLLNSQFMLEDKCILKEKMGIDNKEKIILFVGRLVEEKRPLELIDLFARMAEVDDNYRLIIIGEGPLLQQVKLRISKYSLESNIRIINKVLNKDMWMYYCVADVFINLNKQEIFGMAILEAMFYGCTVIAWKAPGPELIIEDGRSGYLVESIEEIFKILLGSNKDISNDAYDRVANNFTWRSSAKKISSLFSKMTN